MRGWKAVALGRLAARRESVEVAKRPSEVFELFSIPAHDEGEPQVVHGVDVGSSKLRVAPGDVLISKIVPHIQRVWIVPEPREREQIASSEWIVLRAQGDPRYLRYQLLGTEFHAAFMATVDGMSGSLRRARPRAAARINLWLPPTDQQRAIADFLDRETAQIDTLIAKQQRLIETLRERRGSVITSAFGGFEPVRLKNVIDVARPLTYGIVQAGLPVEDGVMYLGPSDIVNHKVVAPELLRKTTYEIAAAYERSSVCGGDVVVSIGPAYGKTTLIPDALAGANLTQDTARVACDPAVAVPQYVQWVLRSDDTHQFWDSRIMGATFRRLNLDLLAQTPIPLPSIREQREVADELDAQTTAIDTLIVKSERLIELSKERRAALITAAVTGQIRIDENGNRIEEDRAA